VERDSEIILAARSIRAQLPALLGDGADRARTELDALLAQWDRQPDPSVIDRIMTLLTAPQATRDWVQDFLAASDEQPARTRGGDVGYGYGYSGDDGDDGGEVAWHDAPDEAAASSGAEAPDEIPDRPPSTAPATAPAPAPAPPPAPATAPAGPPDPGAAPTAAPRPVYGLLNCPETALAGQEFELVVGVADQPSPKVAGPNMTLPATSASTYTFSLQLLIFGFTLRDGESQRQTLQVSAADPYFSVTLHLTPATPAQERADRRIEVMYSVDGQPIGFAVRYVTVTRSGSPQAAPVTAGGENLSVPAARTPADLTVTVSRAESEGELAWQFESPHDVDLPAEPAMVDIRTSAKDFAASLTNGLSVCEGTPRVFGTIRGKGRDIADATPAVFWDLLGQVAALTDSPPTVMFFTDEPYIPWELAYMDQPLDPGSAAPLLLCAQARVGRWLKPRPKTQGSRASQVRPAQPPPTRLRVTAMGVVSGVYSASGYERLKEAEAECQDLATEYRATKIEANEDAVIACVEGRPAVEILHFAVHGQWDPGGPEDGLVLLDGTLSPDQVNGGELAARPLVFLNACQVGQANEVLGDYAGMAAAFLKAGASAVVAPLWSIDDATARSIAMSFYREVLTEGVPPAEVLRRARAGFKSESVKQSSTYLAYQFFGDPRLELVRAPSATPPPEQESHDATA
jgi:hypothetical protein